MKLVFLERESFGTDISIEPFRRFGEVTAYPVLDLKAMPERVKDAEILFINKAPINGETMRYAKKLKLICEMATGFDNVDLTWCREHGVAVVNTPDYSTTAVAQHTFALVLALLGKTSHYDNTVKSGRYAAQDQFTIFDQPITELNGKTWGIAGMGHIGRTVARIAEAFGCRVISYSTSGKPHSEGSFGSVSFDEFLNQSDIISLHCPLTDRTYHLFDRDAFRKMKPSAVLINVARGKVVDQHALAEALNEHFIAAAGLDVLEEEPISAESPLLKLRDSSRILITPHMAWASVEARQRDADITYNNICEYLAGRRHNRVD